MEMRMRGEAGLPAGPLPGAVRLGGRRYALRTDFRVSIEAGKLLPDREGGAAWKLERLLALYFPVIPAQERAALEFITWFYCCGREERGKGRGPQAGGAAARRVYDFTQDGAYIYAAFYRCYRIDLVRARMHWWKFRALLEPLVSGVDFSEIVRCRAADPAGTGPDGAGYLRRMQKLFALGGAGPDFSGDPARREEDMRRLVERRFRQARDAAAGKQEG